MCDLYVKINSVYCGLCLAQNPSTQKTNPTATGGAAAATTHRQVRTERSAEGATKTITTETVKRPDGLTTVTVTEKTEGPGPVTKIKVAETVRKADGSTATETKETTQQSVPVGEKITRPLGKESLVLLLSKLPKCY